MKNQARVFVSPAAAVAFLAVGVTGVMLLLHVRSGPVKELHEWMGLVFAALGAVHLILNWRALLGYFKGWQASVAAGLAAILVVVLLLGGGDEEQHRQREGQRRGQGPASVEGGRVATEG
ncbi:MAG: DUF4405 domain-containing protein [Bacillota bacterium]